jgi:phosphate:Na+ symporter
MFTLVRQLVDETDDKHFGDLYKQITHQEEITDQAEYEIARFLEDVSSGHLSAITKKKVRQIMREIGELESIGDACYNMARTLNRRNEFDSSPTLTRDLRTKLDAMMQRTDDALTQMNTVMTGHTREHDINDSYRIEEDINQMRNRLKAESIAAVNDQQYDYVVGTMFSDLVGECEKLGDYVINVVQARFGK